MLGLHETENNIIKSIGNKVAVHRFLLNMSKENLSHAIGVSKNDITKIETGEKSPTLELLYNIAETLKIDIRDFFVPEQLQAAVLKQNSDKNQFFNGKLVDYDYTFSLSNILSYYPSLHVYNLTHKTVVNPIYHQHHGFELIILLKGKLKILLIDSATGYTKEQWLENPFDSLLFNALIYHAYIPKKERTETISVTSDTTYIDRIETEKNEKIHSSDIINKIPQGNRLAFIRENIKRIRGNRYFSKSQLAKKIARTSSYITKLENGQTIPTMWRLFDISKALQTDIYNLFHQEMDCALMTHNTQTKSYKETPTYFFYNFLSIENTFLSSIPRFKPYLLKHVKNNQVVFHEYFGWELIILRKGKLKLCFKTGQCVEEKILQNAFDQILFNSNISHAYIAETDNTESICINTAPLREFIHCS